MGTLAKIGMVMLVLALLATGVQAGTAPAVVSVDSNTVQVGQEFTVPPSISRMAVVSVESYKVQVGQEFTVPVRIAGVSNLYGADVRLKYDPAVLTGVRVDHGYFLQPDFVVRKGFYGTPPSYARYALTQVNPTPPASGSGVMMYVTFKALQPGTSPLALSGILSDRNGVRLPFVTHGGTVTVVDTERDR